MLSSLIIAIFSFALFLTAKFIILPMSVDNCEPFTTYYYTLNGASISLLFLSISLNYKGFKRVLMDMSMGFFIGETFNQCFNKGMFTELDFILSVFTPFILYSIRLFYNGERKPT